MRPADFFKDEAAPDSDWSMNGDPWSQPVTTPVFDVDRVLRLREVPEDGTPDLEAAYALTRQAHSELELFGTSGEQKLSDEEVHVLIRALIAVLRRLGIPFNPPFRDFTGFHGYWSANGMSGSGGWAARRGYLNELFNPVFAHLEELEDAGTTPDSFRGVDGEIKNIIFASTGPKPEIVLRDFLNNVIEIVRNGEHCLTYNRPLTAAGLTWGDLTEWWSAEHAGVGATSDQVKWNLYRRLLASVKDNSVEKLVFETYYRRYRGRDARRRPALLPQVYLHYDPLTAKDRQVLRKPDRLKRERMDFLLLLPNNVRIVIEVDGKQHYADGDVASPMLYSEMMAEDRELRLRGYEVYRFGGYELTSSGAPAMLDRFFDHLEARYGIPSEERTDHQANG